MLECDRLMGELILNGMIFFPQKDLIGAIQLLGSRELDFCFRSDELINFLIDHFCNNMPRSGRKKRVADTCNGPPS